MTIYEIIIERWANMFWFQANLASTRLSIRHGRPRGPQDQRFPQAPIPPQAHGLSSPGEGSPALLRACTREEEVFFEGTRLVAPSNAPFSMEKDRGGAGSILLHQPEVEQNTAIYLPPPLPMPVPRDPEGS